MAKPDVFALGAIRLRGVRVHNLQSLDLDIPRGRITAVAGVSGSGKSSLVLDTLYAEGQRRYVETFSASTRQFLEKLDKPDADRIEGVPPAAVLSRQAVQRSARATVGTASETHDALAVLFAKLGQVICWRCGATVAPSTPDSIMEFAASQAEGARLQVAFPVDLATDSDPLALAAWLREDGFARVLIDGATQSLDDELPIRPVWDVVVDRLIRGKENPARLRDSIETAFAKGHGRCVLAVDQDLRRFSRGWTCMNCGTPHHEPEPRLFSYRSLLGACPQCSGTGRLNADGAADPLGATVCPDCQGAKLKREALAVKLNGFSLADLSRLTAREARSALDWIAQCRTDSASAVFLARARRRLQALEQAGLETLPLDRPTRDLSAGEAQRLALTAALGSGLVGMLYVLDEPSTGLAPPDIGRLVRLLSELRDSGNTVVTVEHDESALQAADWLIELGPGPGRDGGRIVFQGQPSERTSPSSPAGERTDEEEPKPKPKAKAKAIQKVRNVLRLQGATGKNLKDVDLEMPLGAFVVVAGPSGAGKSALIGQTLMPALRQALQREEAKSPGLPYRELTGFETLQGAETIDSRPIGRSGRSNPATFLKAYDEIRSAFASTAEAKLRNYKPAFFSFNAEGGRCSACEGSGVLRVDMKFLPDVLVRCPECGGTRFRREALEIAYRGKTIAEVLDLTAREAFAYFKNRPKIQVRLRSLMDLGLDYLRLGQPASTLSGGEAQRLKLGKFLASTPAAVVRSSKGARTFHFLDEPTAGLHPSEFPRLIERLRSLVDLGHSLAVVSHRPEVAEAADWVIEMGPGAGADGGRIVAQGPPSSSSSSEGSASS